MTPKLHQSCGCELCIIPKDMNIDLNIFITRLVTYLQHKSVGISLLTWPPCIASVLNIKGWYSLPIPEDIGELGTVPIGLHAKLYPTCQTSVR